MLIAAIPNVTTAAVTESSTGVTAVLSLGAVGAVDLKNTGSGLTATASVLVGQTVAGRSSGAITDRQLRVGALHTRTAVTVPEPRKDLMSSFALLLRIWRSLRPTVPTRFAKVFSLAI